MSGYDRHRELEAVRLGIASVLTAQGRDWAPFAAAVAVARGALGLDPDGFGRLLGVDGRAVLDLERGHTHPALAPVTLADIVPEIDWAGFGVPVACATVAAPRNRHPSAHRPARVKVPP